MSKIKETKITEKIPFTVFIPIKEVSGDGSTEKPFRFTGLARTTDISLNRNRTTEKCIRSVKKQITDAVERNQPFPSFIDHDISKVCGNIVGVKPSPDSELWPITELLTKSGNPMVDAPMEQVENWYKNNVQMGQSTSGYMTEAMFMEDEDTGEWWFEIDDMLFLESSITNEPALQITKGTVTAEQAECRSGFCNQIIKQALPVIKEKYPSISEALLRERQINGKIDESNKEEKTMDEETTKILEELKESNKVLTDSVTLLVQREKARMDAEEKMKQEKELADMKEQMKKELLDEIIPAITEHAADASETVIKEKVEFLLKEEKPPKKSDKIEEPGGKIEEGKPAPIVKETGRRWSVIDSVNYPPVLNGHVAEKGYTPDELAQIL